MTTASTRRAARTSRAIVRPQGPEVEQVVGDADRGRASRASRGRQGAVQAHQAGMAQQQVVGRGEGRPQAPVQPGRVVPEHVPEKGVDHGLVDREPVADPVAQRPEHGLGVEVQVLQRLAADEAAAVLQPGGQVPVEQGGEGADAPASSRPSTRRS